MTSTRYDLVARLLHWLIGLALIAQIAFGFLLDDIRAAQHAGPRRRHQPCTSPSASCWAC